MRGSAAGQAILEAFKNPVSFYLGDVSLSAVTTVIYYSAQLVGRVVVTSSQATLFLFFSRSYYLGESSPYKKPLCSFDFGQPIARGA